MGGPKHPKDGSQNALLQGRNLWKTLLEHTVKNKKKDKITNSEENYKCAFYNFLIMYLYNNFQYFLFLNI
jgi:hypothetical protein